jgi:hypothetical protein
MFRFIHTSDFHLDASLRSLALGSVWIEKIENHLALPETEKNTANEQQELRSIMQSFSDEASFSELAMQAADEFVGNLPPEGRHEFGGTESVTIYNLTIG